MNIINCPNCNGSGFSIIEQSSTTRKKRSGTVNGKYHYHNHGIHQEIRKCIRCGCKFILRTKDICQSCDFNESYRPQIIIIKKGRKIGDMV